MDGEILGVIDAKLWLRIDHDEEDKLISMLIVSSESYLKNATGIVYTNDNRQAKLFCLVLVTDWYENRELTGQKVSEKVRFTVQSMLAQLQYAYESEG